MFKKLKGYIYISLTQNDDVLLLIHTIGTLPCVKRREEKRSEALNDTTTALGLLALLPTKARILCLDSFATTE
jgi:hypothetical protein